MSVQRAAEALPISQIENVIVYKGDQSQRWEEPLNDTGMPKPYDPDRQTIEFYEIDGRF